MELNILKSDSQHVIKASNNVYQFAASNEFFNYYILRYKIREFDVRGALEAGQYDVAYWASKHCLKTAISIFLFCKGIQQYSEENGYFLLERLKKALIDEERKYLAIRNLLFSNKQNSDEMINDIELARKFIYNWLIPTEVWKIWGDDMQFNFNVYLSSVLTLKRAFKRIDKALVERPTYPIDYIEAMHNKSLRINKGR